MQNYGLIRESTSTAVLKPLPMPTLPPTFLLIEVIAIALNPTDWTTLDAPGDNGTLVGCDYAGIVLEVGPAVTKPFKKGDRVAGFSHGGNDLNPQTGAFAKYIITKGDLQMRIPEGVSFEVAATVGSGFATSGYALFKVLGFPWPGEEVGTEEEPILVYGGSTASGTIGIQLAKLAGKKVLTTCSPKHFELMKDRGADDVFDYVRNISFFCFLPSTNYNSQRSPTVASQVRSSTSSALTTIYDTVNLDSTAAICAAALSPSGGTYVNLLDVPCPRPDVKSIFFLGYDLFGEPYRFEGDDYVAKPELFNWAVEWMGRAERLWAEGGLKPHPERVRDGGLRGAIEGMNEMREGRGPSGEKWVYRVGETGFGG